MLYTQEQIEQIREATNIVDLIGETVRLRHRGRNYTGLCPFHNEKTPSFSVQEDKGIFKCFGCGKAGDVFTFVMESEGLTFPEAIERLAERANITLETDEEKKAEMSERESVFNACREAAAFYYRVLRSTAGEKPMKYLRERGLELETLKQFGVGYAVDQPGMLMNVLHKKGFYNPVLEKAGIISAKATGEWYERFRGRIMFPVFSASGRIIGFGGRVLPGANANKEMAKYVNSPDTVIYHKSNVLYGLYQAKDAIRKLGNAIVVEGYADVLAVSQAGFKNVVAASGTSLTKEQLELLRRYTTSVILLFDADQAGKNAAMRGIEIAIEAGFDVDTVVLPKGEDPDSFIRKSGAEAFGDALVRKQPFIETKAQWFEEQGGFSDPAKATVAIRSIMETVAKIPDAIKRDLFIRKIAMRFRIMESTLLSELNRLIKTNEQEKRKAEGKAQRREQAMQAEQENAFELASSLDQNVKTSAAETELLKALLEKPDDVLPLIAEMDLSLIGSAQMRAVFELALQLFEQGTAISSTILLDHFRGDTFTFGLISDASIETEQLSATWQRENFDEGGNSEIIMRVKQSMLRLQREQLERERTHLTELHRQYELAGDQENLDTIVMEIGMIGKQLEELRQEITRSSNLSQTS